MIAELIIAPCSCREIFDSPDAAKLFAEYAAECSLPELGQIAPQMDVYERLETLGTLRCFAVRAEDGELVGFAALLVTPLPHYGKRVATTESIFVSRTWRSSGVGAKLLATIEDFAKQSNCAAVLYTAPTGSQFEKLLGLKYRQSNSVFVKQL